jgi:hypothetical protein
VSLPFISAAQVAQRLSRPRLFKSTGMSWEDAVVASALVKLP